jgi:hypothetical protein
MKRRTRTVGLVFLVLCIAGGACTSGAPKKSASPSGPSIPNPFGPSPTSKTLLLVHGGIQGPNAVGNSSVTRLDATAELILEGACIGTKSLNITVQAQGPKTNFSSLYTFTCGAREKTTTVPLGRFARGTKISVLDQGSSGTGAYWVRIQKS